MKINNMIMSFITQVWQKGDQSLDFIQNKTLTQSNTNGVGVRHMPGLLYN